MKAFVVVLALVAAVAGDASVQPPNSYLQPPVDHQSSKDFNAPWVEENTWRPAADPHQPIHVTQQSSYNSQVQLGSNNQDYQQQYQPHEQVNVVAQQSSYYAPVQHGSSNQDCEQDLKQYQPQQSSYTPEQHSNSNQDYQQDLKQYQPQQSSYAPEQQSSYQNYHNQEHQQGHYQSNNAPSSVAVQVTHPDWATSFSNVNRYNTYWPAASVAPVMVQFVPTAPAAPAAFSKPTQASVAVYNNNVAKWNPWKNNQHSHQQLSHQQLSHQQLSHDITQVPHSVAKYVAITPGSIHIAPLPGHKVSHKFLNLAHAAGSW